MSAPSFSSFIPSARQTQPSRPSEQQAKFKNKRGPKEKHREKKSKARAEREPSPLWDDERDVGSSRWNEDSLALSEATRSNSSSLWVKDTKGDNLNVQYGGPHSRAIPRYFSTGHGGVLGLNSSWRYEKGRQELAQRYRDPLLRAGGTRFLAALDAPRKRLHTSLVSVRSTPGEDFISLSTLRDKDAMDTDIHDVHWESAPSESETDTDSVSDLLLSQQQSRIKELENTLSRDPRNEQKWLDLMKLSVDSIPASSKNASRVKHEIATSILQRALKADSQNDRSVKLRLSYMAWGEALWHASKTVQEWEVSLKLLSDDIVWLGWLGWRIRYSHSVGFEGFLSDCQRCLHSISQEKSRLTAFWRIVVALGEAGYSERATAIMQAQCCLAFGLPENLKQKDWDERLRYVEEYWDSEQKRPGESNSELRALPHAPMSMLSGKSEHWNDDRDPYITWLTSERVAERHQPAHAAEEGSDEDPFATVLFSDIRMFLIDLLQEESVFLLKRIWLCTMKIHVPGLSLLLMSGLGPLESEDGWSQSQLLRYSMLDELLPSTKPPRDRHLLSQAGVVLGEELRDKSGFGVIKENSYAISEPLVGVTKTGRYRQWEDLDLKGVDVPFIRQLFLDLRQQSDLDWDCLALAFEAAISVKSAIKLSKTFLDSNRQSLRHWVWHAQLELLRGNELGARKVFDAACVLARNVSATPEAAMFYLAFAEHEWLDGREEASIAIICKSAGVDKESYTAVDILRVKGILEERCEGIRSTPNIRDMGLWTSLRALLELLTGSLPSMFRLIDSHLEKVYRGTSTEEIIHLRKLAFLRHHYSTLGNVCPRSFIRSQVSDCLQKYPNNTFALGFFLDLERGEGVWGRVRGLIGEGQGLYKAEEQNRNRDLSNLSISRFAWDIWVVTQWSNHSNLEEVAPRLRQIFIEREQYPQMQNSFIFWRLYIEFELRVKNLEKAKTLLLVAISRCPLNKDLHLLAFGPLRSVFSARELDQLMEVMVERGIRVRKELQATHLIRRDNVIDGEVDHERDEVETRAEEYRRLLPY